MSAPEPGTIAQVRNTVIMCKSPGQTEVVEETNRAIWTGRSWMTLDLGRVLRDVAWWRPEEAAQ